VIQWQCVLSTAFLRNAQRHATIVTQVTPRIAARPRCAQSPSRTKLSAAVTMDSSFERGVQPSTSLAFSLVEFLTLPSSGSKVAMPAK